MIFLEGGITQMPHDVDINVSRNMPDLLDAPITRAFSCKEIYSCLAEVLLVALSEQKGSYVIGNSAVELSKDIMDKAKTFGFKMAPLQCFDRSVERERIIRVAKITKKGNRNVSRKNSIRRNKG